MHAIPMKNIAAKFPYDGLVELCQPWVAMVVEDEDRLDHDEMDFKAGTALCS